MLPLSARERFSDLEPHYIIPKYDRFSKFLLLRLVPLYQRMRRHGRLDDRACTLWTEGRGFMSWMQLFSHHRVQVIGPDGVPPWGAFGIAAASSQQFDAWTELAAFAADLRQQVQPREALPTVTLIRRQDGRKLREHAELMRRLKALKLNCVEVAMEESGPRELLELLHNTRVLVGAHGAGLLNMMFMRPGGRVIELQPEGCTGDRYRSSATAVGLQWKRVAGNRVVADRPDGEPAPFPTGKAGEFSIPVEELVDFIRECIRETGADYP